MNHNWDLENLAQDLGISMATLKNWKRNGSFPLFQDREVQFPLDEQQKRLLVSQLADSSRLKQRANRKERTRSFHAPAAARKIINSYDYTVEQWLYLFFKDFKLSRIGNKENCPLWLEELRNWPWKIDADFPVELYKLLENHCPDDPAGELAQWQEPVKERIMKGSFYTPYQMINQLFSDHKSIADRSFFDPAMGSGRFMIAYLQSGGDPSRFWGMESNELSWRISRMNYLRYSRSRLHQIPLFHGDTLNDALSFLPDEGVELMATNPPWGRLLKPQKTSSIWDKELFCAFIHLAMNRLTPNGQMLYLLPQSLLNQKKYIPIRESLCNKGRLQWAHLYKAEFPGVQSPPVALNWQKNDFSTSKNKPIIIHLGLKRYSRKLDSDKSDWDFYMTPEDKKMEQHMYQKTPLRLIDLNPQWLLGIVTGDNQNRLKKEKRNNGIIRGKDIQNGKILESHLHLNVPLNKLQQYAPMSLYRSSMKVVYSFIAHYPRAALDEKGRLLLNSANGLILPEERQMRLLVKLLNSNLYRYYYKKKYHSLKILRSHLEQLPFPDLSSKQWQELNTLLYHSKNSNDSYSFDHWLQQYYEIKVPDEE